MKKKIFYLMVVALALTMSSFTLTKKKNYGNYYWFPLESYTGFPRAIPRLIYQPYDPELCLNWGLGTYCSGAFLSYTGTDGQYFASGMEVMVDFQILP